MSSTPAGIIERAATVQAATQRTAPTVVSGSGGQSTVAGAPAVAPMMGDRTAMLRAAGYVTPNFDAAAAAKTAAVEGVGSTPQRSRRGATNARHSVHYRHNITPATGKLLDRFAAAEMTTTEANEIRKAAELFKQGYRNSQSLRIVVPPNYKSRVAAVSDGTLVGFSEAEVSAARPPESAPAEVANKEQGYMRGQFSNNIQATFEASAAKQPASTITGVILPVMGAEAAAGFGAAETAVDTVGRLEEARMSALTDPYATREGEQAVRKARFAASAAVAEYDTKAAPNQPMGGVVVAVKPSGHAPTPKQAAEAGAVAETLADYIATDDPTANGQAESAGAGEVVGVDPVKTAPAVEAAQTPMLAAMVPVTSGRSEDAGKPKRERKSKRSKK